YEHIEHAHMSDVSNSFVEVLQDGYFQFLSSLFEATLPLVRAGGNIAAVLRPARMPPHDVDSLLPFTAMTKALGKDRAAVTYHVAAARDGSEEWHIIIFRKDGRDLTKGPVSTN
ncbi:MAG: hypothetical protein M3511_09910, partial [Deinococcota bacterium]|nr:hypothetical protein [Deinococcota bacterium]